MVEECDDDAASLPWLLRILSSLAVWAAWGAWLFSALGDRFPEVDRVGLPLVAAATALCWAMQRPEGRFEDWLAVGVGVIGAICCGVWHESAVVIALGAAGLASTLLVTRIANLLAAIADLI